MFRPINSDDHTAFRPPSEHVKRTDPTHRVQKRDFSYEIEQVQDEDKEHKEKREEPFGEDTFESSAEGQDLQNSADDKTEQPRTPPASGHVDVQI